jgi:hypothetical protein
MFDPMAAEKPQVPVKEDVAEEVELLRDQLANGKSILNRPSGTWGILFEGILWHDPGPETPRYGANLLQFCGHIGEAIFKYGDLAIPQAIALLAMMPLQPEPRLLSHGRTSIELTEAGVKRLGVKGRIKLSQEPIPYVLSQELLAHAFDRQLSTRILLATADKSLSREQYEDIASWPGNATGRLALHEVLTYTRSETGLRRSHGAKIVQNSLEISTGSTAPTAF